MLLGNDNDNRNKKKTSTSLPSSRWSVLFDGGRGYVRRRLSSLVIVVNAAATTTVADVELALLGVPTRNDQQAIYFAINNDNNLLL
mmetsp:Transcript_17569/g.42737  ORF Transcript_17569/g.42737 Transcript_17569/m.42737 type:complete len:86 (-) Transcript_17569:3496-3753(-)